VRAEAYQQYYTASPRIPAFCMWASDDLWLEPERSRQLARCVRWGRLKGAKVVWATVIIMTV
jgi:hypothetical protein